jgi:2-aminoadipate transaminase
LPIKDTFPALSPFVKAIPKNPLRALLPFAARPGMMNLASGHPSRDAYDSEGLTIASQSAAADPSAWSYGPSVGDPQLLVALEPLGPKRPDGHRLIVTSGAQQAVDLSLRSLASPGSTVLVPEPIYPAILSICAAAGLQVRGYRIDAGDPGLTDLSRGLGQDKAAAIYVQPTFSNPGGETWDTALRLRFLQLCADHHVPVIEDDPYRSLWYGTAPPPALVALSGQVACSVVVWAGSLSKMLAPGLRLGWAIVPEALAGPMTDLRQAGDLQPNSLAQRVAVHYLESGRLEAHLTRMRGLYATRRDQLAAVLGTAGFDCPPAAGGMFLFPTLPPRARREGLFERALARDVLYAPGQAFALDRSLPRFDRRLRLCFAGLDTDTLGTAAARLVAAVKE